MTLSRPERAACPVCDAVHAPDVFFALRGVPVTCASVFESAAEARAVPTGDIDLTACPRCGFVFACTFDPALGEVGARYESSQAASTHFSAFAQALASDWVQRYRLAGKTVLEIGCGGGHFLGVLRQHGVARAIGMDPFAETGGADPGVQLIADKFDTRSLQLQADAVVCRHTLEHIQDVSAFLQQLRAWTGGDPARVLLFEVPDAERVFAERAFWDVYYEHCNYFTAATLRFAFESAGFDVLRLYRVYDDQYLIIEGVARQPGASAPALAPDSAALARAACNAFATDVRSSIERCQRTLEQLSSRAPPLVLWQGAAKTVGFLAALGNPGVIDSAIDLSPARRGKFLPGSGLAVHAPEQLVQLRPGNIVLMNPVYLAEVTARVRSLGLDAPVHSVNDLLAP